MSFELLEMAGLVKRIYHASGEGIPIGASVNRKKFKALFIDTGVFLRQSGLKLRDFITSDNIDPLNKGNVAEQLVGLELLKYNPANEQAQLHYWHREKRGSNAEVDYIMELENQIIPIEVKSGTTGKMQSMNLFIKEKPAKHGIRISLENFTSYGQIKVIPLYAVSNLFSESEFHI